jgi:cytochrome c553
VPDAFSRRFSGGVDVKRSLVLVAIFAAAACEHPTEPTARGDTFYDGCRNCHGEDGQGGPRFGAPPIAGLDAWYIEAQLKKFRAGLRGYHPDDAPGLRMRPMSQFLPTDREVADVALYVSKLPTPPAPERTAAFAQASTDRAKTAFMVCTACHGADGSGNQALGAPPIAGHPDWYVFEQLKKFKAGRRGALPQDAQGATMRAIAASLDEPAMIDLAAYVSTLPKRSR